MPSLSLSSPAFNSYRSGVFVFESGAAPAALASVQFLNLTRAGAGLEVAEVVGVASTGEAEGSALAEAVGVAFAGTVTPLFQVSLDPDLVQVNFLLPTT